MHVRLAVIALAGILQLGQSPTAAAVEGIKSADELLRKMSLTLQEKNYRGLFTYEFGGNLDTVEIVHFVDDNVEYERLQHLNGQPREVVRVGRHVDCINTAARLLRGGIFRPDMDSVQRLQQYYDVNLVGSERIAGRPAAVLRLVPKDAYRFGWLLAVDARSGFPLKTLIVDAHQRVLERVQAIDVELGVRPPDDLPTAAAATGDCGHYGHSSDMVAGARPHQRDDPVWQAQWLPRGFVLSDYSHSPAEGAHLTYTDGVASFSVFVTPAKSTRIPSAVAQRGATVALMLPLSHPDMNITVVGEIPPVTAEQVAVNVRRATADDRS